MILQRRSNASGTAVSEQENPESSRKRPRSAEHSPIPENQDLLGVHYPYAGDIGHTPDTDDLLSLDFYDGDINILHPTPRPQDLDPTALQLNTRDHYQHPMLAGPLSFNGFDPTRELPNHNYLPSNGLQLELAAPLPDVSGSSDILIKLARLNESLTCQVSRIASFPKGTAIVIADCVEKLHEFDSDLANNPVTQALESTADLTTLIKQVSSPAQGTKAPMMPAILLCLSSHLQLLQLYDTIFNHVYQALRQLRNVVEVFEAAPPFGHITGLPAVKGNLYIKIIIQVVEHHLGTLERLIGLPSELCLSGKRASSDSVFGYVASSELLRTIMTQTFVASEKSGSSLLISLRANIKDVIGLLG
ncbi:Fc.00g102470.m01.CDS01 [Cosmosporella sp. VM-42]